MRNQLIALSLVAIVVSSAWLLKSDAQASRPASHSVSIAQVFSNH